MLKAVIVIRKVGLLAAIFLIVASAVSVSMAEPRAVRPELDLRQLQLFSYLTAGSMQVLPTLETVMATAGVSTYEDIVDRNGIFGVEASPVMKPCCVPGSTGTQEHLLKLYILESKGDDIRKASGLILEITGYCTLEDVSMDMAAMVMKAESLRGVTPNFARLKENIIKTLAVAHYRWYMAGAKNEQLMAVSILSGLDFTIAVDPEGQKLKLIWPALLPNSTSMLDSIKYFDEYREADKLGMEAIVTTNYNAFALSCEEEVVEVPQADTGTT